uniref:Secreted protein n=1 Tax=Panagrellus redivivus TaxID=6233 RepID=A0A7E4VU39_PANRE
MVPTHIVAIFFFLFNFASVCIEAKRKPYFIYQYAPNQYIRAARYYGRSAYADYLVKSENMTMEERQNTISDFLELCNDLGWEYVKNVTEVVNHSFNKNETEILMKIGLDDFLARFLTLDDELVQSNVEQICLKTEMQLQCQLGFGESRTAILYRLQKLKKYDGNMQLLLEKDCNNKTRKAVNYPCMGHHVMEWTKDCMKEIDEYNKTRIELNQQIIDLHLKTIQHTDQIIKNSNISDEKLFIPTKIVVENLLKKVLHEITGLESKKCRALGEMTKCILPHLTETCGPNASEALRVSLLVGYLNRERSEALNQAFKALYVDADPICIAMHTDI